jgi:hypothetical protein
MHVSDRNRLEKETLALLLAEDDMLEARAAAEAIQTADHLHLRWALDTALSVAYARAFTKSTICTLDRDEYRPVDPALAEIHDLLIETRDSRYAHTDKDGGREATLTLLLRSGLEAMRWNRLLLPSLRIPEAIALCDEQRDRFRDAARERRIRLDSTPR